MVIKDPTLLAVIEQLCNQVARRFSRRSDRLGDETRTYVTEKLLKMRTIWYPRSIRALIKSIAWRFAWRKSKQRPVERELDFDLADEPASEIEEDVLSCEEDRRRLLEAISTLSDEEKKILELVGVGMSARKAAAEIGIPFSTYRRRRNAILLQLKQIVD